MNNPLWSGRAALLAALLSLALTACGGGEDGSTLAPQAVKATMQAAPAGDAAASKQGMHCAP
ncbi:Lipoprotein [Cupriavidus necator]|uniref:Uncharacterized protein n=1 Tax=Cupriavidus necator (strain ATCC 17699 / DSM 428 / KCTC 22496 / NCIMB 10442 / H16 / Stanier 337) TaxID=381666 RepID=A0AAE5ZKK3_CUPNH|nr:MULTISPECIES: hypothetical protein [Cupriavidus]EON18333.1 hypothetical protein C265_17844 [Cupriavidus sp. GA3-3]KUE89307.1 hypothetical protein ASL20_08380 [Cupriavidus necator]QCC03739.1 hypothetical protein E6A55_24585 [Cupriavidus necator H16]QQB80796.1 hypothetical protein I6H87_24155 [Cupriavidus necator]WKA45094.1 hypothetical protein QWP09_24615 [Cupriavidus necator]